MNNRFAVKRLSAVEVNPDASNQHELNATRLRQALEIREKRLQGPLTLAFYCEDGREPVILKGGFTLYNSREGKPRSAEYRLYYDFESLGSFARPGDLFVVFRSPSSPGELLAIVARQGTYFERKLQGALDLGELTEIRTFLSRQGALERTDPIMLVEPLLEWSPPGPQEREFKSLPVFQQAVSSGRLPPTRVLAKAAQDLYAMRASGPLNPDSFLSNVIDLESGIYFELERTLLEPDIRELKASPDSGLDDVLALAMSCLQSRKSRRGQSLQHHFARLLELESIPFTPQCTTEAGETPDFVIPGCAAYHDPDFPSERLRMVGCKTKVRERWRQYLEEAERIPVKYHLSLDPDWTDDTIRKMHESGLRSFLPESLLERSYAGSAFRNLLRNVKDLVRELEAVL